MKNLKLILLSVTISLLVSSCHKDIPKDIPNWLRTRIIEIKKERKKKECGDIPIKISEYQNSQNQEKIYVFGSTCRSCGVGVYDFNGNFMCSFAVQINEIQSCGGIYFSDYDMVRVVWTEKCK